MLSTMDRRLNYLIVWCSTLICICGGSQDLPASCDVMLTVRRGTIWRVASQESLTVSCPVKHCGDSLDVTWCKVVHINRCERIHETENVEIRQIYKNDDLISYLSFKKVSVNDDGLYRCDLIGRTPELFSHAINISVSDENHGDETSVDDADESPETVDVSWLSYFSICFSIASLVVILAQMQREQTQAVLFILRSSTVSPGSL
ncbi:uncharacterized protein PAE49_012807 [Odontesthes bonariensis]